MDNLANRLVAAVLAMTVALAVVKWIAPIPWWVICVPLAAWLAMIVGILVYAYAAFTPPEEMDSAVGQESVTPSPAKSRHPYPKDLWLKFLKVLPHPGKVPS